MSGIDAPSTVLVAPLVVVAVIGIAMAVRTRRSTGRSLAADWPHTSGTVLSATVQVGCQGEERREAPLVLYSYQVNGQVFRGNRVCVGRKAVSASGTIARYPAGASVRVYYDPADPANCVLER